MSVEEFLVRIGASVSGRFLYDFLRQVFYKRENMTREEFEREIESFIKINGGNINSEKLIEFLASDGFIDIKNSRIYAKQNIFYQTGDCSGIVLGSNTISSTDKSSIQIGKGCSIVMGNNTSIVQGNGNISFYTGKNN